MATESILEAQDGQASTADEAMRRGFERQERKSVFSSLQVPPEILAEVFMHYMANHSPHYLPSPSFALLLGQICRFWRQVAFDTPAIWENLSLKLPKDAFSTNAKCSLWELQTWQWTERAKASSKSFKISVPDPCMPASTERFRTFLGSVLSSFGRNCRNIDLDMPAKYCVSGDMSGDMSGPASTAIFSHLESLELHSSSAANQSASIETTLVLGNEKLYPRNFPRLRKLHLYTLFFNPISLCLPWSQLTHLSTGPMMLSWSTWNVLFRQCLALVDGRFNIDHSSVPQPSSVAWPLVTFHPLSRLSFGGQEVMERSLFSKFSFPALRDFSSSAYTKGFWFEPNTLSPQLRSLHRLFLSEISFPEESTLLNLVLSMPDLEELSLNVSVDYAELVDRLTVGTGHAPALPNLHTLFLCDDCFARVKNTSVTAEAFAHMVKSRGWSGHSSTQCPVGRIWNIEASLVVPGGMIHDVKVLLADCVKNGLYLNLDAIEGGEGDDDDDSGLD